LRPIQAVFFDRKWFITSQGTVKRVSSIPVAGVTRLYGTDGTSLERLYANPLAGVPMTIKTALWPMGDPIRDKQALKFGVEAIISQGGGITATVDSEVGSSPSYNLADNQVIWTNIFGNTVGWTNNASATIGWINSGYQLYKSDAQQWGKYLGLTLSSNSAGIVVSTLEMEHELRARF
jgi:hypothetical protein